MKFKKTYSEEEISEVISWFKAHEKEMPASLDLDAGTHIPDFPSTLEKYIIIARLHKDKPSHAGQVYTLFKMRDRVAQMLSKA